MTERFEPEDLLRERRITDIHALPGHPAAICAVQSIDGKGENDESMLWSFGLETGEARQLTHGPALDRQPRLSPDGRQIAFLSDRTKAGTAQLHLLPFDGGEARPLSRLERGVLSAAWQPQGRWLLVRGNTSVDPNQRSGGCQRQDGARAKAPDPQAPQLCWRLPYKRDGTGYVLDTRIHLFLVDAHSGDSHQLTHGDFDVRQAAWAPDGRRVCFSRTREKAGQEHCTDIWSLSLKGHQPGHLQRLSFDQDASGSPSWSPDGRWIVFSGALEAGDAQTRLWLIDVEAATVRPLGDESLEVLPGELHWSRDAAEVALIQAVRGLQQVAAVAVPGGQTRCMVGGERHIAQLAAHGGLVYTSETAAAPLELFCSHWHGGEERPLSQLNSWWTQRRTPHVAYRSFEVPDGRGGTESVDGWLLRPAAGHSPARPGPLLVDVHGGPASYAALDFSSHPYWQILCSRGWSVLALNTVGSSSYGRAFSERLRGRWGELDLP